MPATAGGAAPERMDVVIEDSDIAYEEDILRNAYSVKAWTRYLEHKTKAHPTRRFQIYERAVKALPGSYKLWYRYLQERVRFVRAASPVDKSRAAVNACFDRALVFMHKMPRIWLDYLDFLVRQGFVTKTRRTFDECLRALPITQHHRVWPAYLAFVRSAAVPEETALRVYRRYLQLEPNDAEEYVDYLTSIGRMDEAADKLREVLNRAKYTSKQGKTKHQLWMELCKIVSQNPEDITSLRVEPIIRGGLRRFTDMVGSLWCSLADYHIGRGSFEKARDVYEEAIQSVMTVRDFSQIFEAYSGFEEETLSSLMDNADAADADPGAAVDLELRMARFEALMARRPLLLSSVLLRQNPHAVDEWLKRVSLHGDDVTQKIATFTEAVRTVDPSKAVGSLEHLWVGFARMYEENGNLGDARVIFDRAVDVPYRTVDELANVWCEYAEMEIRAKQYKRARHLLQRATAVPARPRVPTAAPTVQQKVQKSLRLWSMYVDLEESLGTFESCKGVYARMLELRVASPQVVINFALFLEEAGYFEESFSAFERGIALFRWPAVYELWNTYLVKFVKRYAGAKLERTRELFEQCLERCQPKYARTLYVMYAQFEEEYGLARHALEVYRRATQKVLPEERYATWQLCVQRAAALFGVTHSRQLYGEAVEDSLLSDKEMRQMCLQFAELERKLGEVDRARAIYSHASQVSDPRVAPAFWQAWNDFEVQFGNEDTFREMLRIKRSVAAQFNTAVNMAVVNAATGAVTAETDAMAGLESAAASTAQGGVAAAKAAHASAFVKEGGEKDAPTAMTANTAEIALDMSESESEDGGDGQAATDADELVERAVPAAVFGDSLAGAKERFAARRNE